MAIATGQVTIVDFHDAVTLTGYISSNHTKSIRYNGDAETYTPDFTSSNLVLTPSLFKAGSVTDLMSSGTNIKSVVWKRKSNLQASESDLSSGETVGAAFPKALTVSSQPFSSTVYTVEYICTITYTDPTTGLDLIYKNSVTFSKVADGNNVAIAEITADPGFAFKNKVPTSLTLTAKLFRGATKDTSNLSYQWQKLTASAWTSISGATSVNYSVTQASVNSMQQFRVIITDTVLNDTYTSSPVSVLDFNDPVECKPYSTNGEVFKNGIINTDIIGRLFQNGQEIDVDGTGWTYSWTKVDKDGNASAFGTGKTISVGSADINARDSFFCTAEEL